VKFLIYSAHAFLPVFFLLAVCSTVPVVRRKQPALIPSLTMLPVSSQQYDAFLKENKPSANQEQTQRVKRVRQRIRRAVEQYMAESQFHSRCHGPRFVVMGG